MVIGVGLVQLVPVQVAVLELIALQRTWAHRSQTELAVEVRGAPA